MKIYENFSLKKYNSLRIDAKAKYFAKITKISQLQQLIKENFFANNKYIILGSGTNILFTKDFDGIVLKNNLTSKFEINNEANGDTVVITASSGIKFDDMIQRFLEFQKENNLSLFSLENLAKIPGDVGSAVVQNIGAYGVEQKDFFICCQVINLKTGNIEYKNLDFCNFAYRNSIFKQKDNPYFILDVIYSNRKKDTLPNLNYPDLKREFENANPAEITPLSIYATVSKIRESKLPDIKKYPNAGSFFKNPMVEKKRFEEVKAKYSDIVFWDRGAKEVKVSAAWLIEHCGLKGKRIGNVGIHKNHSLILVSYKNATGNEVVAFANFVINEVKAKFGVEIEPEVVYV